jgi:predicted Ser/Thr protein kinase
MANTEQPGESNARDRIAALAAAVADEYATTRRVLSFAEWFALLEQHPRRHARSAAEYVRDAMVHFGRRDVRTPGGLVSRFRIFDRKYAEGFHRLVGQETAQNALFDALDGYCRLGRVNSLLLLHGPNGSAKSTILECLKHGVEAYSKVDAGAVYAFAWIFPRRTHERGGIGFEAAQRVEEALGDTYARLADDATQARVVDETKDHPIFLVPHRQRAKLLESLRETDDAAFAEVMRRGDLSARNRKIFDALLDAHEGDLEAVYRHVQVERVFLSRTYRTGLVDVEPKQTTDARSFAVVGDRAFSDLPASVGGQTMHSTSGDLVDANRGIINFSDLLKRPYEHFKYLLTATETGTVALDHVNLQLDLLFTGSANDIELLAFREMRAAEFESFRARLRLIPVGYLLDYRVERKIYQEQVGDISGVHIAPHVPRLLALWGVMTRMRRPDPSEYDEKIRGVVENLTPLQKADLYAYGRVPEGLSSEEARDILAAVPQMHSEEHAPAVVRTEAGGHPLGDYEGSFGASVRDLKGVLLSAASQPGVTTVTMPAIFDRLRAFMAERNSRKWMLLEPQGRGFHSLDDGTEQGGITWAAWQRWLDLSDHEVREAMGLVDEDRYLELFTKYVVHAKHSVKKEQIFDERTGASADPDERFMKDLESVMDPKAGNGFREDVLARIGAWALSHPNEDPVYDEIFADYFARLREDYYRQQKVAVTQGIRYMLDQLDEGISAGADEGLDGVERERAQQALARLLGEATSTSRQRKSAREIHTRESLRVTLVHLSKERY